MDILVANCEKIITLFKSLEKMPQEFSRDMAVNDLKPSGFRLKELARMFEEGRRHEFSTLKTVEDFLISFPCQRCKPANKQ